MSISLCGRCHGIIPDCHRSLVTASILVTQGACVIDKAWGVATEEGILFHRQIVNLTIQLTLLQSQVPTYSRFIVNLAFLNLLQMLTPAFSFRLLSIRDCY